LTAGHAMNKQNQPTANTSKHHWGKEAAERTTSLSACVCVCVLVCVCVCLCLCLWVSLVSELRRQQTVLGVEGNWKGDKEKVQPSFSIWRMWLWAQRLLDSSLLSLLVSSHKLFAGFCDRLWGTFGAHFFLSFTVFSHTFAHTSCHATAVLFVCLMGRDDQPEQQKCMAGRHRTNRVQAALDATLHHCAWWCVTINVALGHPWNFHDGSPERNSKKCQKPKTKNTQCKTKGGRGIKAIKTRKNALGLLCACLALWALFCNWNGKQTKKNNSKITKGFSKPHYSLLPPRPPLFLCWLLPSTKWMKGNVWCSLLLRCEQANN